jgi:adenine C2-methylase RlmN of 23S rRNA A2503 and tRNA A37
VHSSEKELPNISKSNNRDFKWLPCFNTILPKHIENNNWDDIIFKVLRMKDKYYNGFLHFQLSINSTNEDQRKKLFGGANVAELEEIIKLINTLDINNRTITLNFIVMKGIEVDVLKLKKMGLTGDKFCVKLIPMNKTENGADNGLETVANYDNYEELEKLGKEFNDIGVPTVIDAIAKCEEAGLCCGQLVNFVHEKKI